ncbi:hypothetical protein RJ639_034770 [Escallonia herrerae]|uniref:Receptor ligand binding region domain-containing protein n=1 Tax=Escallonia herrerae TaxID=1293975 RepID=A0AA89BBD2_9ASTE|nr:hypothetical protein RJ639_034770 [Escallonia herrerae]
MITALSLLKDERVDAIIGPQKSEQANFVMDLGERAHVPIISFSATSPSLLPQPPNYFLQTAQSDDTQVGAIAAMIKSFQWKDIVMIFEDTVYGKGIVPYLANALQDVDARFSYRSVFPLSASDDFILKELYKMMTMQTRVFVVQMSHSLAARLFLNAKEIGMMNKGYAWIMTSGLMDIYTSMEPNVKEAMHGVLGVKHQIPPPVKQGKTSIKLDAAVGDITITANRSLYVDFTLPYAEGGVSLVVPVSYEDVNNKWTFLKPLRMDLWVTSIGFFILTGFGVWVLEHRINVAFRGPPSHHVGMMLWFPFSTLVFPRGSPLVSDVSRAVIKIIDNMSGYIPTCTGPENTVASNSISLESFAGLFGITGGVTTTCLLLFLVIYLLKNKDLLRRSSLWSTLCAMCRHFDQRDVSSYPFSRNKESQDLELQDISVSSHFGSSPALPRSSHSSDSRAEVEGIDVNDQTIHCSSEDVVIVHQ